MEKKLHPSAVYRFYKHVVYPHISDIRGTELVKRNLTKLSDIGLEKPEEEPTNIFDREWNNLILLDACRHDTYERITGKDVESITSVGSHSREFVEKTFSEGTYEDVVYITANPHISHETFNKVLDRNLSDVFFEIFLTHETDWDDEYSTVLPEAIVRDSESAEKLFPEKKKIIHFMQPHGPFLGALKDFGGDIESTESQEYSGVYGFADMGKIKQERVVEVYEKNLEFVFPYVEQLIESLEGKTVVSADHGEFLGENGVYGHPYGTKSKPVKKVPWDIYG